MFYVLNFFESQIEYSVAMAAAVIIEKYQHANDTLLQFHYSTVALYSVAMISCLGNIISVITEPFVMLNPFTPK